MAPRWPVAVDRAAWWVVGVVLFGALTFVVHSFVGTFVFGVFIYYSTRPLYRYLDRVVRPSSLAAAVALLLLALPALLLVAYTIAVGLQEANRILETVEVAQLEAILQPYIDVSRIVQEPEQILDQPNARAIIEEFLDSSLSYLGFIGNALLHLFVMIGIAFYLLRDDNRLAGWFTSTFDDQDGVLRTYAGVVDRDFSNIFFGNILNAALTGAIGGLAYNGMDVFGPAAVNIPYPTLLGLLTGIASLVPVVGMKLVYVPVTLYLAAMTFRTTPELLWFPAAFALVSFVIVDVIPDLVLRPYVSGRSLHIGMVMFAYIFGPLLFGWYGIFLGPMLLVLIVHFVRIVLPNLVGSSEQEASLPGEVTAPAASEERSLEESGFEPAIEDVEDGDDGESSGAGS
jgi:predicted PurR-regulated permease PerM